MKRKFYLIGFILLIIIVGVTIYFINNKNNNIDNGSNIVEEVSLNDESTKSTAQTTAKSSIQELEINNSLVTKLYNYIEKTPVDVGQYYVEATFYKDKKTTYSDLNDEVKILTVFQNLSSDELKEVDSKNYANKISLSTEDETVKVCKKSVFDSKLKSIFGNSATVKYKLIEGSATNIEYLEKDQEFVMYNYPGGGFGAYSTGVSKIYKAETEGDNVYIYDKYVYRVVAGDKVEYYTSSDKKELIASVSEEKPEEIDQLLTKYSDKIQSYKHTFSKDGTGNYNWVSTEQL